MLVMQVLKMAYANAVNNHNMDPTRLFVRKHPPQFFKVSWFPPMAFWHKIRSSMFFPAVVVPVPKCASVFFCSTTEQDLFLSARAL